MHEQQRQSHLIIVAAVYATGFTHVQCLLDGTKVLEGNEWQSLTHMAMLVCYAIADAPARGDERFYDCTNLLLIV